MRLRKPPRIELEPGDRALVDAMLAGDREAFDAFFESHFPALYRFTLARLRDPEVSRDVVQTAIVKAIDNLHSYRGEASLSTWLFTICRYEISAHFRQGRRSPDAVELEEEVPAIRAALESLPASFEGPDDALRHKEVARQVHSTLDHLPSHYGTALEWKYVDGLSVKEIASRLDVGPKAAESLLTRARNAFKDAFSAFGDGAARSRPAGEMP